MRRHLRAFFVRLGGLFTGRRRDRELADELASHLQLHIDDLVRSGVPLDQARRAALLKFGAMEAVKDEYRDRRGLPFLESIWSDIRFAARALRRTPAFTLAACLTLTLGIGGTTAIFSAVNPVLFEPLPYPASRQLVSVLPRGNEGSRLMQAFGTFRELIARSRSLESAAVLRSWQPTLTGTDESERLEGQRVSDAYFRVLGVAPAIGRDFEPADDIRNRPRVAILSDGLWRRRFGADRTIVGRQIQLDGDSVTVVGVMPRTFENILAPSVDVWVPLQYDMALGSAWGRHLTLIARLQSRLSLDQARAELDSIARAPVADFPRPPHASLATGLVVSAMGDDVTSAVRPAFALVLGAALLLLTIACINVANLLLGRGARRRAEFAVRASLGAGRARLTRLVITESLLLALAGGTLGVLLAAAGLREFVALAPPGLPRVAAVGIDGQVFAFAACITTLVGVLVGLVPAVHVTRADLHSDVRQASSRSTAGHRFARQALVVIEVALAIVLLVGAGLLFRSLQRLFAIDPGFTTSRLLTMQIATAGRRLDRPATDRFLADVQGAVRAVPGVTAAAFTSQLPLSGDQDEYGARFEGDDPNGGFNVFRYAVTPGYFEAIDVPLRRGRLLDGRDGAGTPPVVVISESLARRKFGGADPLGHRVRLGPSTAPLYTVVGVVGDIRQVSLVADHPDAVYMPATQSWFVDTTLSLVVRSSRDAAALTAPVKHAIRSVDSAQPIVRVATMEDLVLRLTAERRFAMLLFEMFAGVALALAAIGIYGVMSSGVTERTRELGVRAALGATRPQILASVMRQGLALSFVGVALGLIGAMLASRLLVTMLFQISPIDAVTYAGVVAMIVGVAALACLLPAWRAARIDPVATLRAD